MSANRKYFDIGAEVLFYESGKRVYGFVWSYPEDNDDLITIEVLAEDDSVLRYVTIEEQFVREANDPDDPEEN